MVDWLFANLNHYLQVIPLEVLVFTLSFIEEIIPPIPAFPIMLSIGGAAKIQDHTLAFIFLLAVMGSLGKTLGSIIIYHLVARTEDLLVSRFGVLFNLKPDELETFGKRLGKGYKDYIILTFVRALPVIPSVVISVGAGILKLPLKLVIVATFLGTIVRDGFYLYAGYVGTNFIIRYLDDANNITWLIEVCAAVAVLIYLIRKYLKARANRDQS